MWSHVSKANSKRGSRWGFAGRGIRPFLSAGYGIGSKIVQGFGIQISAGYRIGHKMITGYGIQIPRRNEIRSELCSVYPKCDVFFWKLSTLKRKIRWVLEPLRNLHCISFSTRIPAFVISKFSVIRENLCFLHGKYKLFFRFLLWIRSFPFPAILNTSES